jgi:hypothetical protein
VLAQAKLAKVIGQAEEMPEVFRTLSVKFREKLGGGVSTLLTDRRSLKLLKHHVERSPQMGYRAVRTPRCVDTFLTVWTTIHTLLLFILVYSPEEVHGFINARLVAINRKAQNTP